MLATIYAPNTHQDVFITQAINDLLDFTEGQLVLGGDFNVHLLPLMDTSSRVSTVHPASNKRIMKALHKAQLMTFGARNILMRKTFTFYSSPHKSYSRIDYFLIPHGQLHGIRHSAIGDITWSDHAPVSIIYSLSEVTSSKD